MSDTRTIKIVKQTVCGGKTVSPGDVVEASLGDAFYLVNTGSALPVEAKPVEQKTVEVKPKRKIKMIKSNELNVRDLDD